MTQYEFEKFIDWFRDSDLRVFVFWLSLAILFIGVCNVFFVAGDSGRDDWRNHTVKESRWDLTIMIPYIVIASSLFILPLINHIVIKLRNVMRISSIYFKIIASGRNKMLKAEQRIRELEAQSDQMDRELKLGPYAEV